MSRPSVFCDLTQATFGAPVRHGAWELRTALPAEMPALAALRGLAFRGGGEDGDRFDARCLHLWIENRALCPGMPLATVRMQLHPAGDLAQGYTAQFFDLGALAQAPGPALELGRLCVHPDHQTPDTMRLIWAGLTRVVDATVAARLIGCTSFAGNDPAVFGAALALLAARHLGPEGLRPGARVAGALDFADRGVQLPGPEALAQLPPLLRAYLSLGGWVGHDLVIDRDLGTCHVFTCVEIATMPEARKRLLRALAGGG